MTTRQTRLEPAHTTQWGELYQGDCLEFLRSLPDSAVDLVFADPPFNLGKHYGKGISDALKDDDYLRWSKAWLAESTRVLAPGGALFVFNLPRWLIDYGAFLNDNGMMFRHWIAMRMPKAYPRGKKLSPAHYGCLYYTKGEPKTFNRIFVPIQTCRHCGGEIRDYGGHRKALNERGINLMDVIDSPADVWSDAPDVLPRGHGWTESDDMWDDIPPVRHSKYKTRGANELAPLMLERLIGLATNRGDLVVDPFGGSGTTFYAAERLERRWLGSEMGDVNPAIRRLTDLADGVDVRWERARGSKKRSTTKEQLGLLESADYGMPTLEEVPYDGFYEKTNRLGLDGLLNEMRDLLGGFELRVLEKKDSNGGAALREVLDARFKSAQGWKKVQSGGIDWTKCHRAKGIEVCLGIEIQVSARSDMLVMDIQHLRAAMIEGRIDVGVLAVPSDKLGSFLTDRAPCLSDARRHVDHARASDLPILLIGLTHDGPGDALPKRYKRTDAR